MSRNEVWKMERFASRNILQVGNEVLLRDGLLLEQSAGSEIADRMAEYHCFATLICYGPRAATLTSAILEAFDAISIGGMMEEPRQPAFGGSFPTDGLVWSASPVEGKSKSLEGCILRASSRETRVMKQFLSRILEQHGFLPNSGW